jgi:flagellar basal-body rod protein FlgC
MNLFGVMDISASALRAQRVRAEVVAANMANAETTRTADGSPYQRQHVVLSGGANSSFQSTLQNTLHSALQSQMTLLGTATAAPPGGVAVAAVIQDASAPLKRYEPGHPDADADGFVAYPDINPLTEMVDLMGATRSYGMNLSAVQAEKAMIASSMDLLK